MGINPTNPIDVLNVNIHQSPDKTLTIDTNCTKTVGIRFMYARIKDIGPISSINRNIMLTIRARLAIRFPHHLHLHKSSNFLLCLSSMSQHLLHWHSLPHFRPLLLIG